MSKLIPFRLFAAVFAMVMVPSVALAQLMDPIPGPIPQSRVTVGLEVIASGLTAPNWGTAAPGLSDYLFVTDQPGRLLAINVDTGAQTLFADVTNLINTLRPNNGLGARTFLPFDERGLLGVAFHPTFRLSGLLYTYTSEAIGSPADFPLPVPSDLSPFAALGLTYPNHQTVIREWTANDPGNPADGVSGGRVLMRIDSPQFNHNGGAIEFDDDGMLLIAIGDGGGADDSPEKDMQDFIGVPILGHGEAGNGLNPGTILGSILRIDPAGTNSRNGQYGIPADNPFNPDGTGPFGGQAGCADGACDEIFAYGFRNPFRMSVDRDTGLILTGDVGQNDIEEVDIVVSGGNYGWKIKEGTFFFDPNGPNAGFVSKDSPGVPPGMIDPIAQYDHDEGVSAIGGFVYRGRGVRALRGRYVFGDYTRPPFDPGNVVCAGRLFVLKDKIGNDKRHDDDDSDSDSDDDDFERDRDRKRMNGLQELQLATPDGQLGRCVLGFGQDAAGEVYVMANTTGIPAGNTGVVLKIVRP
jgi:glucose/arabinose dehydrogenase